MKQFFLTLVALSLFVCGQNKAQSNFKVSTGTPYKVVDAESKEYLNLGDNIIMFKRTIKQQMYSMNQKIDLTVQIYNTEKREEIKRSIHSHEDKTDILEGYIIISDKLFLMFSRWDKDNTTEQLFCKELDIATATFGEERLLIQSKGKISRRGMMDIGKFNFFSSFDKKTLLVQYRKRPENVNDKINKDKIGFYVFDNNLKIKWNSEVKMPYTEEQMDNLDYQVDANGNVFLLASVNDQGTLLIYSENAMEEVDLSTNKYELINPHIIEGSEGTLYLAGLYSETKSKNKNKLSIDGVFMTTLDKKGKPEEFSYYKIPKELLIASETERDINKIEKKEAKGKPTLPNLKLKKIITQQDGSIIILLEESFITITTVTKSDGSSTTTIHYFSKEDYIIKISKEGGLLWMKKLPKYQEGKSQAVVGSKYFKYLDNHYLFFLDSPKNKFLPITSPPKLYGIGYKGGLMMVYIINDKTGEVTKNFVFDLDKIPSKSNKSIVGYQFSINRIAKTATGFAFEVYKKNKEDVMIHVDF